MKKNSKDKGALPERRPPARCPVVGLGASAGGLEAFSQFLSSMPADTGMAFVLIQHLAPNHESILAPLLDKLSDMAVREVTDGITVEPNNVYVIPPKTDITIANGRLALQKRHAPNVPHMPIDTFFRSLAQSEGQRAFGVVMSGTGSDGSLGLQEIRASGGVTFAQDPATSKYDSMPRSAIAANCVDFVLSPQNIARELQRLANHPYVSESDPATSEPPADDVIHDLKPVLEILRKRTGVDFGSYKVNTIRRRLERRMLSQNIQSVRAYVTFLDENPDEVDRLCNDVLIKVTKFFRDPETFEFLKRSIFQGILDARAPDSSIRIWVPACSTGEEVYSHAMCLLEFLGERSSNIPIQIFGTDISDEALAAARQGSYLDNIAQDVSEERLSRFFTKENGRYVVNKSVRNVCIFAKQNLLKDPPFSRIDLISCRNLLIYLNTDLQRRIMPIFHFALNPNGLLLLGSAETIGTALDLFGPVEPAHKLFMKKSSAKRAFLDFPGGPGIRARKVHAIDGPTAAKPDLQKEVNRVLIDRYALAGVVVNGSLEVVQFIGNTNRFLQNAPGMANFNLMRMANERVLPSLDAALKESTAKGKAVSISAIPIEDADSGSRSVTIEVVPISVPLSEERFWAVMFKDDEAAPALRGRPRKAKADSERANWQAEMRSAKAYLEAVISEKDTAYEELQSANEEIISNNEELQSINEEVQTGKEELQSTNEELVTLNDELQHTNASSARTVADLNSVLESVNIPIVIVDESLRLRRFTARAETILNLIPADVGRPLTDVNMHLRIADLVPAVQDVLNSEKPREIQVRSAEGHWFLVRVRVTRGADNRRDGAVIVLIDVDSIKRSEEEIISARNLAESTLSTLHEPLIIVDAGLRVVRANPSFFEAFGGTPSDIESRSIFEIQEGQWNEAGLRSLIESISSENPSFEDYELNLSLAQRGQRYLVVNARRISDPDNRGLILVAFEDVTDRRLKERNLLRSNQELEDFAHVVAHDLQAPLHQVVSFGDLLKRDKASGLSDAGSRHVDRIQSLTSRMSQLIKGVLDYAKATKSGQGPLDLIDMNRVLSDVKSDLASEINAAGGDITSEDLPTLRANKTQITQLLENLIGNALKYRGEASPRVHLSAHREGPEWIIAVRDNGVGIGPQYKERIFGMFQRVRESDKPGSGIGLAICKKIVEAHGGRIWVESEPAHGATFKFSIPA